MQLGEHTAAVDNDFVDHLIASHLGDETFFAALNTVFEELGITAVMHPLVYENELMQDRPRTKELFRRGIVTKVEFADIFEDDSDRQAYYIFLVKELYRLITSEELPIPDEKILTRWVRRKSLGEVHSLSMCLLCGCGIFLSDDRDAKYLETQIPSKTLGAVKVYNRNEFFQKHQNKCKSTTLSRPVRRKLTHQ